MPKLKRRAIVACAVLVALALALTAARALSDARAGEREEAAQEEATGIAAPEGAAVLEEGDAERAASYTGAAEEAASLLEESLWMGTDGTVLRFARGYMGRSGADGETDWSPFVLLTVEKATDGDGWRGSVELDGSEALFELTHAEAASGAEQPWQFSCTAVSSAPFARAEASGEFSIVGAPDALLDLIGGEETIRSIEADMRETIAERFPIAREARVLDEAEIDFGKGQVRFTVELDTPSCEIDIYVDLGGGVWSIQEV